MHFTAHRIRGDDIEEMDMDEIKRWFKRFDMDGGEGISKQEL